METRSNHILVGTVTLLLLLAVVLAAFWFSRIGDGDKQTFDIFFKQSVSGLAKGSGVSYSGVPSGQVKDVELWEKDPAFVRVRIVVDDKVPILQGTTATVQGVGFTGVSEIQLDGGIKGAPPIVCPRENLRASCPEGVPVIPTKPGALGELLSNAPQLLQRLSTLTERLTELLNDKNQASIGGILANTEKLTKAIAERAPEIAATLAQTKIAIQQAGDAAEQVGKLAGTTNALLDEQGRPLMEDLRTTVRSAKQSMDDLDAAIKAAKPGVDNFSQHTMPEVDRLVRDLRRMSGSLKSISEKIDQQGAASIVGAPGLPDYRK